MRKIALLLLSLLASPAYAGVSCSVPFNLQNGNTADATQVMANYNAIIACLGNAAGAGVNVDITALAALTTPLTPAQGGTSVYVGGTSTGTANAQVVGVVTPASFALTAGNQITFIAGASNTNSTTLNIASTGATNVFRKTQLGISALVGGEIVAGHTVTVEYDGTQYQLISAGPYLVGEIRDWTTFGAPTGWALIDGSCQARAGVLATLFSVIGTQFDPTGSTCDSAHFAMPDGRGRMLAGYANMGGTDPGRITNAGSGCNAIVLGIGCGTQNQALTSTAQLPQFTPTFTGTLVNLGTVSASGSFVVAGGLNVGNGTAPVAGSSVAAPQITIPTFTPSGTISTIGNSPASAFTTLNPIQVVAKIIKY